MGLGRLGFWMLKTGLGIGVFYATCRYCFGLGRMYEKKADKPGAGIEVSRQVMNDAHDLVKQLRQEYSTPQQQEAEEEPLEKKVEDENEKMMTELEKLYEKM
jgi:hypothetical protein